MLETIFYILIATIIALAIAIILMSVYYTEKLEKAYTKRWWDNA